MNLSAQITFSVSSTYKEILIEDTISMTLIKDIFQATDFTRQLIVGHSPTNWDSSLRRAEGWLSNMLIMKGDFQHYQFQISILERHLNMQSLDQTDKSTCMQTF
jgi:hypothetical protein